MTVFSSGISMYAMARLIQALHVFDGLFRALGWPPEGIFTFSICLSALIVLLLPELRVSLHRFRTAARMMASLSPLRASARIYRVSC